MIRPLRRGLKGDSVKRSNESLTPTVTSPLYWERCVCARSAPQSCPTLCDPMDCSPPSGSSVHGISQARILEWVDMSFSRGSSRPRGQTQVFCIGRWVPYHLGHQGSPWYCLKELKICNICSVQFSSVTQSCLTLCDPTDCSPPGSSVHGISQARILEWVDISFSRGSSQPRDRTQVSHVAGRLFTS